MPDVRLNYYALAVAIETNCLLEWAFEKLHGRYLDKVKLEQLSNVDINVIRQFKAEGMTYREIGELYGVSTSAVFNVFRYRIWEKGDKNEHTPAAVS